MTNTLKELENKIGEFEQVIGYSFTNRGNLVLALTHSSFANENRTLKLESNERLEFLGDAVLNIVISEHIYLNYSSLAEGEMTKTRANIVCEASLVKCAGRIHIGDYLMLGRGEESTGGRTRISILSDAFEAVIGAIYLDGGMEEAKRFIHSNMKELVEDAVKGALFLDYKTKLQEMVQKDDNTCKVSYEIIDQTGPDHHKLFVSQVSIGGRVMGTGRGRNKKEAEQNAAMEAVEKLDARG